MQRICPAFLPAVLTAICACCLGQTAASTPDSHADFTRRLVAAAIERTHHTVRYDSAYVRIPYPGGDVPADTGACTDEIIRVYRAVGIDLQKEVHEDMAGNLAAYPRHGRRTDTNVDHRRVPNLMVFFERNGAALPVTKRAEDYLPGDLVTWNLSGNGDVPHIGIVVDQKDARSGRYLVVHNVGEGPKLEDVLFAWKIIGHYRYLGPGG